MAEQQLTEEQRKELQEKLASMSPEELRDFQKQQCIFCRIIGKEMESKIVYEGDKVLGVLDINPAAKGHVVLMPKEHYVISPQIPDEDMGHIFVVAKKLSQAVLKATKAQGTNIFVANGLAAGQKAQHFMVHIIPRRDGDKLIDIPLGEVSEEDLAKLSESIRPKVAAIFGKDTVQKKEESVEKPAEDETAQEAKDVEPVHESKGESKEEKSDEEDLLAELGEEPKKKTKKKKSAKKKSKKKAKKEDAKEKEEPETSSEGGEVSLDDIADLFK